VLTCLQQSVGLGVALLVLAVARLAGHERLPETPQAGILAFPVASGLVQYALAFWLHLVGLRRLPVGVAALFLTLTPFFGMAGGCCFSAKRGHAAASRRGADHRGRGDGRVSAERLMPETRGAARRRPNGTGRRKSGQPLTLSLSALAIVIFTTLSAGFLIVSPVAGLRTMRSGRSRQ
jgi:hypothetical protein